MHVFWLVYNGSVLFTKFSCQFFSEICCIRYLSVTILNVTIEFKSSINVTIEHKCYNIGSPKCGSHRWIPPLTTSAVGPTLGLHLPCQYPTSVSGAHMLTPSTYHVSMPRQQAGATCGAQFFFFFWQMQTSKVT